MKKRFLNSKDYQECFKFDGYVPFINSYDFVNGYKDLDGIAFLHDGRWYSYISLKAVKKTSKDGLRIYSDSSKYEKLKKETYQTNDRIIEIYKNISGGKNDLKILSQFFSLLANYRLLYRKTEFFYTDLAFEKKDKLSEIKNNFSDFGEFKMKARILLNSIFFNNDSYLKRIIDLISSSLKIEKDKLALSSTPEILNLVKGKKLDEKELERRRKSYFIYSQEGIVKVLSGSDAQKAIDKFIDKNKYNDIKGRIAYPGIVKGRAKVIKVNIKNYDKMNKIVDEMKQGEILVAETTEPSIILACKKASAIVTNQGGMMSHAAIVARELKIPCIVGTNNATEMINDGDFVEVDADKGIVKIIEGVKK